MDYSISSRRPQPSSSFLNTPYTGTSSTQSELPLSIQTNYTQPSGYSEIAENDVPDLFHDYDRYDSGCTGSPPSAASSSQMPTPLYDWDMPLPTEGSPGLSTRQKSEVMRYSLDQWPSSAYDCDYHPSSAYGYPDELGWEQGHKPDDLPSYYCHSTASSQCDPHSQPDFSNSHSATSATYDTQHHKSFTLASSLAASSTSTTISPSILGFAEGAPSAATSTLTSAISHLRPAQLHHPRPSRRIPIISLAELASASDQVLQKRVSKTLSKPPLQTLSPLPELDPSFGHCHDASISSSQLYSPSFLPGSRRETGTITCSCGCMGSYAV